MLFILWVSGYLKTKSWKQQCETFMRGSEAMWVIKSHIPHFHLFTVTLTTFDPNLQWKGEECTGRVNEKEGREEWITEWREEKGGGEKRNKTILSGFSCDWWGKMLKRLSALFLSSPRFLFPLPFLQKTSPKPPLPEYYYRNKSCVFPKHLREKLPNTSKTRQSHLWWQLGE